ncbi:MAG: 30S ribosomal protein S18 [Candidatus Omnitrophica bacterium]|nr:30S ribosomal protein S18 [Candidatus Omnitrophota bacterium]
MRKPKTSKTVRKKPIFFKRRVCLFCKEKPKYIDYKDTEKLRKYITERGKIRSRRTSGACAKHQRMIAAAIKRARFMALLPYVAE